MKKKIRNNRTWRIFTIVIACIAIILLAMRIALPYFLLPYVEKQINKLSEYKVKIKDLDIHLYRGAYTLKSLQLWKITKNIPVPFFSASAIDFSVDWPSLLHGKILAKVALQQPKINFVVDPNGNNEQVTISKQWLDIVKTLYPLNINRLDVYNGKISLISFKGNPPYNIYIRNVEFIMKNMQKATNDEKLLSSQFELSGEMENSGHIYLNGRFDPFAKKPTFKLEVKLNSLEISQIGAFLKHYSSIDVSSGIFSLYGEMAAAKGKITGYVKPFIKNLKIGNPKNNNPVSAVINAGASVVAKILENSKQKTIATKINISGNIEDPDKSVWSIIGYLLQHAFLHALLPQVDHKVKMQDVTLNNKNTKNFPTYRY